MSKNNLAAQLLETDEKQNSVAYFQDFLQKAFQQNFISTQELEHIHLSHYELLTNQLERFTCGNSSSVAEDRALTIQRSILYTVGIYLKSLRDSTQRIEALKEIPLASLHNEGKKVIQTEYQLAKNLLSSIQKSRFTTENIAYNDTVFQGIPGFFSAYDMDYSADDTPGSIDYPLSNDPMEFTGVEYIYDYLCKLYLENKFCEAFPPQEIICLLRGYDENNKELLINIFTLVLTNALASSLAEKTQVSLEIQSFDRLFLQQKLSEHSQESLYAMVAQAADDIITKLTIGNKRLKQHIRSTASTIVPRLENALDNFCLQMLFFTPKEKPICGQLQYTDGITKDNEAFRCIVDEIRDCRYVSDKIAMMKREILSISDFIDILEGWCIFDDEFYPVFDSLSEAELSILIKNAIPELSEPNQIFIESDKEWQKIMLRYFNNLENDKKARIMRLAHQIDIMEQRGFPSFT